jgi:serine/threonine protein kinase
MLSIFSSIKTRLFSNNKKPKNHKYNIVFEDEIMPVDLTSDGDNDAPPPPSPVVIRRLFNIELDNDIIKKDYELQKLVNILDLYQFNVDNVILERRIEQLINNIPNADDIMKIKIKILYVIIAHDLYRNLFEEKKRYHSTKTTHYVGVFRYNDYIIRIDDSPYSFINEADVVGASVDNIDSNIIQPFLIYTNIRRNSGGEICECLTTNRCECKYTDDVTEQPSSGDGDGDGDGDGNGGDYDVRLVCYKKLRENAISFSIQYYVKNTVSLYNWVNDNIGNCAYNKFSAIQHPFFIHLFYQCARLLHKIHKVSVVHGDIKPDNILIREHDDFNINHPEKCKHFTVFLIDFGLSGIHDVGIGTGGTIPYCHPEFKNIVDTNRSSKYNWKIMNKKHDVWSLGVAFITMYIYRDFYNYYHKYPSYFFTKDGYVSSLIIDVITHDKLNRVFTKLLSIECISSEELCEILERMSG